VGRPGSGLKGVADKTDTVGLEGVAGKTDTVGRQGEVWRE